MLSNYIKVAWRNLRRSSHTFINVFGLVLGMVCAVVIYLVIDHESSFDRHHPNAENTYRVVLETDRNGQTAFDAGVFYPLPAALGQEFPEIEYLTIVDSNFGDFPLVYQPDQGAEKRFKVSNWQSDGEIKAAKADPDFFDIFSYEWLAGERANALGEPGTAVITSALARQIFGEKNPLGKILSLGDESIVEITGVIQPPPSQSDLPFDLFLHSDIPDWASNNWNSIAFSVQCFLTLPDQVEVRSFERRLSALLDKHLSQTPEQTTTAYLQPLKEMHFDHRFGNFSRRLASKASLFALGFIGVFILITACINVINLNTAIAVKRAKEIGIRKILGSSRPGLILYSLVEATLTSLIALIISLLFVELALGSLDHFLGYPLSLNLFHNPEIVLFLLGLVLFIVICAGLYPSYRLSRFSPIPDRTSASYGQRFSLRKGLVVTQFTISQVLLIAVMVIWTQIDHLKNADMGFEEQAVVEVDLPSSEPEKLRFLKNRLMQHTSIRHVSFSNTGTLNSDIWTGGYALEDTGGIKRGLIHKKFADKDYLSTYGIPLLAGVPLREATAGRGNQFLVNEAFAKETGYRADYAGLLGKHLTITGVEGPVVGVVQDFNTQSLHQEIEPVILTVENRYRIAGIQIDLSQVPDALSAIRGEWNTAFPTQIFEYAFLDDSIEKFYLEEQKTGYVINMFAGVAILIGLLGLFSLMLFMTNARTKEIGIRKVLGASVLQIAGLMSKDFMILVTAGCTVAIPIGWYIMGRWLQHFAYRIELDPGMFIVAGGVAILFALVTAGGQSIKAALMNPVDSLRSD